MRGSLAVFAAILLSAITLTSNASANIFNWENKIGPSLKMHGFAESSNVDLLIIMRDQANLRPAFSIESKQRKARLVVNELKSVAFASQQGIKKMLDANHIEYHQYYVMN